MNEKLILQEMNFSDELIEYIQKESKLETYEDYPVSIEVETEADSVISSSAFVYSSF